jgi:hypothetical protein
MKRQNMFILRPLISEFKVHNTFCPCLSEINRTSYELPQVINEDQNYLYMGLFVIKDVNCSRTTIINQSYKKVKL